MFFGQSGMEGMMVREQESTRAWVLFLVVACFQFGCLRFSAQDISLGQKVAAITERQASNKAELADYTWQQQEIIKVKDKLEDKRLFQVEFGVDGRAEKMPLDLPEENSSSQKAERGMREWLAQKKQHALQQYADKVKELAESYAEAGPDLLRAAYERRDVSTKPAEASRARLFIHNYVKSGDTATWTFDEKSNALQDLEVLSYLSDIKEPVEIQIRLSRLQNGPDHIDEISATDTKRKLLVVIRRLDYHLRQGRLAPSAATIASF